MIISTPNALLGYAGTTLNFEDIAGQDGQFFSPAPPTIYEPYDGIVFEDASVDASSNVNGNSGHTGLRSLALSADDNIPASTNATFMYVNFFPNDGSGNIFRTRAFGCYWRTTIDMGFKVSIEYTDLTGTYYKQEDVNLNGSDGFFGVISDSWYIYITRIVFYARDDIPYPSYIFIDDVFYSTRSRFGTIYVILAWAWIILIGYILVTPIGPICIACGNPIDSSSVRLLGIVTIILGGIGFILAGIRLLRSVGSANRRRRR